MQTSSHRFSKAYLGTGCLRGVWLCLLLLAGKAWSAEPNVDASSLGHAKAEPVMAVYAPHLTPQEAQQFLTRTGFAASPQSITEFTKLTQAEAVEKILHESRTQAVTPWPDWMASPPTAMNRYRSMTDEERKNERKAERLRGLDLRAWWLTEMQRTPSPVTERMTLFWHNHFVSSQQKVKLSHLMARQNALLRREALGNFATLLHAIAKDPAMLIYLDGATSRKGNPNENFAREVMELFTLGQGHYSENDIKEAARAFTGWSVDRDDGAFVYRAAWHDAGNKTIFNQTAPFDGDAVLNLLLAKPETAEWIVQKLWREFVSPSPDEQAVKRIAVIFRNSGYQIKPALRALFNLPAMLAESNQGGLVKSPVELMVGALRQLNAEPEDMRSWALRSIQLGQNLFSPPNVKGWPGGEVWINSTSLVARQQMIEQLFRVTETPSMLGIPDPLQAMTAKRWRQAERMRSSNRSLLWDADAWFAQLGMNSQLPPSLAQRRLLQQQLLVMPPVAHCSDTDNQEARQPVQNSLAVLKQLMLDPVYQLK